jgi:hypothetical protein
MDLVGYFHLGAEAADKLRDDLMEGVEGLQGLLGGVVYRETDALCVRIVQSGNRSFLSNSG